MAKYVYLDNGRSLLEVVMACKESPLDTVESTVQSSIGSLPLTKPIICKNCRGEISLVILYPFAIFGKSGFIAC